MEEPLYCVATEHHWQLVKEDADASWVVVDAERHGVFTDLRNRIFGPLDVDSLGMFSQLDRSEWKVAGFHRKWACAKCRKIVWDYEEAT